MSDQELTPEELDKLVVDAIGALLNIAAGVADLQLDEDSAEDIYALCDLIADYYGIERVHTDDDVEEDDNEDTAADNSEEPDSEIQQILGVIRTGKIPNFRVVDADTQKKRKRK